MDVFNMLKFLIVGLGLATVTGGGAVLAAGRLEELFSREHSLLSSLQQQIHVIDSRLQFLQSRLDKLFATASNRSCKEQHISNPLNSLALVHRLTGDWIGLVNQVGQTAKLSDGKSWPSGADREAVLRTLARLQLIYNLPTEDLVHGRINGALVDTSLTVDDCMRMARYHYHHREYSLAVEWIEHLLSQHHSTASIMELAALAKCSAGDRIGSWSALAKLLRDYPTHEPTKPLLAGWNLAASAYCSESTMTKQEQLLTVIKNKYQGFCRGNSLNHLDTRCRYVHHNKPHLMLAPFRMEELQVDPPVLIFHDVISEEEIQEIRRNGISKLKASTVTGSKSGTSVSLHRTSETAWPSVGESYISHQLSRRLSDLSNMNADAGEREQLTRYGPGGEFLFHWDALSSQGVHPGLRVATLLIFLGDVPQGGHTVFRDWGLSVKPVKGSAIFWFNLHRNGSIDDNSCHAGCPVLEGTKLILAKWFTIRSTEGKTSCGLHSNDTFKYFYTSV